MSLRAWRLRRAQLALDEFDYKWAGTGLLGGARCYSISPRERERGLRMRRRKVRRVERLGGQG